MVGCTDMLIPRAATTSTPIGVHGGAMHGDPRHSPEGRASEASPPHREVSVGAFHVQDSTSRPCGIMGGTDMRIAHAATTSTLIGVHRATMPGAPRHSPEDRSSEANPPHH